MSHVGQIEEAFDKPYRFRKQELYKGYFVYRFIADDKSEIDVFFKEDEISDDESVWRVSFERNMRQDVTGEGDAMRIFATVIEVLKDFTKKEKPQEMFFSAEKPAERLTLPHDHPKRSKEMGSREKLYKRLVQRYAGRMGYKYTTQTDNSATDFRLTQK
jgi:uncharacterized protein (DUF2267 family)